MVHIPLSFALVGNVYQTEKSAYVQEVISQLLAHQATVRIEREYYDFLKKQMDMTLDGCEPFDAEDISADFVVSDPHPRCEYGTVGIPRGYQSEDDP